MNSIELIVNGSTLDLTEGIRITLDKIVNEYRNPTKKTGTYTYDLRVPNTNLNRLAFENEDDIQVIGKFRKTIPAEIRVDGITLISGYWFPKAYTSDYFEGAVIGENKGENKKIADILDANKTLKDIQSYTPIAFTGNTTVEYYLENDLSDSEICFPLVYDSFARLKAVNNNLNYEKFGVSHFTRNIVKNIFTDAGYTLAGNVLNSFTYDKLTLLYSNESGESMPYNYGALAPLISQSSINNFHSQFIQETDEYYLYVVNVPHNHYLSIQIIGDICKGLGSNEFSSSYIPKFTGMYEMKYNNAPTVNHINGTAIDWKSFSVFRERTDEVINGRWNQSYSNFSGINMIPESEESIISKVENVNFTHKLEEGKEYVVQIYFAVPKTAISDSAHANINSNSCLFQIVSCSGKQLFNPADFLPQIKQVEFIEAIFKIFNLYYTVDEANKVINLYTRDEFYSLNQDNIIDISDKIEVRDFKQTPLTENDVLESYYLYSKDDNDYILNKTDYLAKINPSGMTSAYTLPFAPLAFMKVPIQDINDNLNYQHLPVAVPTTDIVDIKYLFDFTAESLFNYKPKLALYLGNGNEIYKEEVADAYANGKDVYNVIRFPVKNPAPHKDIILPELGFFDLPNQVAYTIEKNNTTQEFEIVEASGNTIYNTFDTNFLKPTLSNDVLSNFSLSLKGEKSIYRNLYRNNLKISNYSNYFEGIIKLNSVLYSRLNGRNIIKAEDDLYLLESITGYDVDRDLANIKLYKMIN